MRMIRNRMSRSMSGQSRNRSGSKRRGMIKKRIRRWRITIIMERVIRKQEQGHKANTHQIELINGFNAWTASLVLD